MVRKRATKAEIAGRLKLLEEEGLKFCPNCEKTLSAEEFSADKRHYDGLQTHCRNCSNLLRRTKWGEKVRATARASHHANKTENNTRSLKNYYEKRDHYIQKMRAWKAKNVERRRQYRKRYHEEHYEEENAQANVRMKQWYQNNRERHQANVRRRELRKKNSSIQHENDQWLELLELCGGCCLIDGETENLTRDHIIPLSWGGTDAIDNIQPLCHRCNGIKSNSHAIDYRPAHVRLWAFLESILWNGDGP